MITTAETRNFDRSCAGLDSENLDAFDLLDIHLAPRLEAGLSACFEAFTYAEDLDRDFWDFAVEYSTLRELSLSRSDLRWLVGKGLLECAIETSLPGDAERSFQRTSRPLFSKNTCFALTTCGVELSRRLYGRRASRERFHARPPEADISHALSCGVNLPLPQWDRDRQILRIGQVVVKQFKVPAANQETVLAAFEEEAWPPRIDDPLPPHREQSPKRRLQETIKSLNRNQKQLLIRFIGDGSGTGVRWEFCGNGALASHA